MIKSIEIFEGINFIFRGWILQIERPLTWVAFPGSPQGFTGNAVLRYIPEIKEQLEDLKPDWEDGKLSPIKLGEFYQLLA